MKLPLLFAMYVFMLVEGGLAVTEAVERDLENGVKEVKRELSSWKLEVVGGKREAGKERMKKIKRLIANLELLGNADDNVATADSGAEEGNKDAEYDTGVCESFGGGRGGGGWSGVEGVGGFGDFFVQLEDVFFNTTHASTKCRRKAKEGHYVKVHFLGRLLHNEQIFSSSFHTGSTPLRFVLGAKPETKGPPLDVWNDAIKGMCTGERREARIPWRLGYGESGSAKFRVPPRADLQYFFELTEVSEKRVKGNVDEL